MLPAAFLLACALQLHYFNEGLLKTTSLTMCTSDRYHCPQGSIWTEMGSAQGAEAGFAFHLLRPPFVGILLKLVGKVTRVCLCGSGDRPRGGGDCHLAPVPLAVERCHDSVELAPVLAGTSCMRAESDSCSELLLVRCSMCLSVRFISAFTILYSKLRC